MRRRHDQDGKPRRATRSASVLPVVAAVSAAVALTSAAFYTVDHATCADPRYIRHDDHVELVDGCLDGATLDQGDETSLGRHVGYMGQTIEFFDGTIAENIARMSLTPDADAVLAAGRAAGAHDMILRLPGGYDSRIGEAATVLSGGQRQRIALARALYGDPFLVVLDEPNANLDSEGDAALREALREIKARGAIVVIISHRPAVLDQCDKVLVLGNGVQQAFGPRDAIMRKAPIRLPRSAVVGNVSLLHESKEEACS